MVEFGLAAHYIQRDITSSLAVRLGLYTIFGEPFALNRLPAICWVGLEWRGLLEETPPIRMTALMNPDSAPQALAVSVPRAASRLGSLNDSTRVSTTELVVLGVAGSLAALAVAFLPLGLRIPGHKILLATLPMMAGLMLVPRAFSGTAMGLSAAATVGVCYFFGVGRLQPAAVFPLLALGPILDLVLYGTPRHGWQLYVRCATAGLTANLGAYLVRWGVAWGSLQSTEFHTLKEFGWSVAGSFTVCGLAAGLLSGAACFRRTLPEAEREHDVPG